jgi:hypothetical protein
MNETKDFEEDIKSLGESSLNELKIVIDFIVKKYTQDSRTHHLLDSKKEFEKVNSGYDFPVEFFSHFYITPDDLTNENINIDNFRDWKNHLAHFFKDFGDLRRDDFDGIVKGFISYEVALLETSLACGPNEMSLTDNEKQSIEDLKIELDSSFYFDIESKKIFLENILSIQSVLNHADSKTLERENKEDIVAIEIGDITIKIIDEEQYQVCLNGRKEHIITKEKINTTLQAWKFIELLSFGNIIGAKTSILVPNLVKSFGLENDNYEKNKNTLQQHKSTATKAIQTFLLKNYSWSNSEKEIIYHDVKTDSYKTLFKLEPPKDFRQKDIWRESKGFDEGYLSNKIYENT